MSSVADLQKEPINPVVLIKDGKSYDPSMAEKLAVPFILKTKHYEVEVKTGDIPVYFKRKLLRVSSGEVRLVNINYAVGFCRGEQKTYCFLDYQGKQIEEVEEWQR